MSEFDLPQEQILRNELFSTLMRSGYLSEQEAREISEDSREGLKATLRFYREHSNNVKAGMSGMDEDVQGGRAPFYKKGYRMTDKDEKIISAIKQLLMVMPKDLPEDSE